MNTTWRGMTSREIIKNTRKYKGLTQSKFAKTINKTQMMVSKYESGATPPSSEIIIHCMNILDEEEIMKVLEISNLGEISETIQNEWGRFKQLGDGLTAGLMEQTNNLIKGKSIKT
jgi:transcriptional regulator with XRE-family HTH domain